MNRLEFLENARNIHGYKYKYLELCNKMRLSDKIDIEYKGDIYTQTISKHLAGRCPEKTTKKKTTTEFITEAISIWGYKYDYSLVEYNGALNNVKIIYNGIIYEQRAKSHLNGLAPEFRKNLTTYKFDNSGLDEIREFLIKYKIPFKEKFIIDQIIFDFYLLDIGYIIEYKGLHHYEPTEDIGYELYNRICVEDKKKSEYCDNNYINLINIKYNMMDDIYLILWDSLKYFIK